MAALWQFRFYTYQDATGNLLRVNRFTEVVTPLRLYHEPQRPKRTWENLTLPASASGETATIQTKYAHGKSYYNLILSPMTPALKKERQDDPLGSYFLQFLDADGFTLATVRIPLREFIGEQDDQGNITELDGNGSISLDANTYDAITRWTLRWLLSSTK